MYSRPISGNSHGISLCRAVWRPRVVQSHSVSLTFSFHQKKNMQADADVSRLDGRFVPTA